MPFGQRRGASVSLGCLCLGVYLRHSQERLCAHLAPPPLAGTLTLLLRKKEASLMLIVLCLFEECSLRTCCVPRLVLGSRDEMENETQVLPSGADILVGEAGQGTDDDLPGWRGLCWRGVQRAICGRTPNAAWRERASWRKWQLGCQPNGLGFEGCI